MIYLDYNASTPVAPEVLEAMLPFLGENHGNPSSGHALGQTMRQAVEKARGQVANLLDAAPEEIIFTSGGTESNNHVIKGVAHTRGLPNTEGYRGRHIITSAVEHPAVAEPCRFLERNGFDVTFVGVDETGMVDAQAVIDAIRPDTILITIMLANNEVGTLQPIVEIAEAAREKGVLVHTDAAQAIGKIAISINDLGVDFLSVAGHKCYAPQGTGALFIRSGVEIEPYHHGAGHQGGRRSGTEPVASIVALGAAMELVGKGLPINKTRKLRDRLEDGLTAALGDAAVMLGHPTDRLPNTAAVAFRDRIGADILAACPDLYASTGAACHSTVRKRSAVLTAMNVPEEVAFGSVRFSLGRDTTEQEIDQAVTLLTNAVKSTASASVAG